MARSTKGTAEDGDPRITVPTDRVESRDLSEPRELSVEEVLKSYEQPINEEQAWAVCYQCCSGSQPGKGSIFHPPAPGRNRGPADAQQRALDDVRKSRQLSCKNKDRLSPVSKKEPEHWKPQQLREKNRGESLQECRSSQRMQRSEESWQQEIRHLKELLVGRDQQICRVEHEKRTLTEDHADTLALLSSTQAALKQEKQRSAHLQEQCCKKLADQKLRHQIELRNQEEGFRREVCENITKQMVSDLPQCDVIGTETRREPEKISVEKETSNRKEIQLLTERIVQLQQVLREKGKKKKQKTKFSLMKVFFGRKETK